MERLTFEGNFCDIAMCQENPCPYNGACSQRETWERLKAYEDTGHDPGQVRELAKLLTESEVARADLGKRLAVEVQKCANINEGSVILVKKLNDTLEEVQRYRDSGLTPEQLKEIVPVPFGTPVYVTDTCSCGHHYAKRCQSGEVPNAERRKKAVAVYCKGVNRRCVNCVKLFERPFSVKYIGKVGKTVFLTREDAEASLKTQLPIELGEKTQPGEGGGSGG